MNLLIKFIKIVTLLQLSSLPIMLHGEPGKRIVCSFPNWAIYRTSKRQNVQIKNAFKTKLPMLDF
jgi:hypothetical protein